MQVKNTTNYQNAIKEALGAFLLCSLLVLTACSSGGDKKTVITQAESLEVAGDTKPTCASLDPLAILSRAIKGPAAVGISETFTQQDDISVMQVDGTSTVIKAGEEITLVSTIERSADERVRYTAQVTPEDFGVTYSEVVFIESSVYVMFPEGAIAGADGLWVSAPLADNDYVENLLQSEPPTALDLRNALFGTDGSIASVITNLPPKEGIGRVTLTESSDSACSFDVEILPEWGNREVVVVLEAKGEVLSVVQKDGDTQRVTTIKVSDGPASVAVPVYIAPDAVGRAYAQS
jgi:hypothetical protein